MEAFIKGMLVMLFSFIYEMLLSSMVHLLGGGVYLMHLDIIGVYCEYGFEGLMCEMKW